MANDRSRDIGPFTEQPDDDMIICRCEEVTKGEIRRAVAKYSSKAGED